MATSESLSITTGENNGERHHTSAFFNALSDISAQAGVADLAWHVEHLASQPRTADVFGPLQTFNSVHQIHGFDTAVESVNLVQPEGVPVEVVCDYNDGDGDIYDGKIVAVLDPHEEEHGAYNCLAVTDMGRGPEVIGVSLRASFPGIAYHTY